VSVARAADEPADEGHLTFTGYRPAEEVLPQLGLLVGARRVEAGYSEAGVFDAYRKIYQEARTWQA
jgi:hypothetical protein